MPTSTDRAVVEKAELFEAVREHVDRDDFEKCWPLIVEYVAEWIETHDMSPVGEHLTRVWREEANHA